MEEQIEYDMKREELQQCMGFGLSTSCHWGVKGWKEDGKQHIVDYPIVGTKGVSLSFPTTRALGKPKTL